MVRLIRVTFYRATNMLVEKDPCSTRLDSFSVAGVYKNCVQDKWVCLCGVLVSQTALDLFGLYSVSVPAGTLYTMGSQKVPGIPLQTDNER